MIKPMLAHKFSEDKADFPGYLQPKLDGVRCVFTKDGAFSRTGKEFMNVDHLKEALKPVFDEYPNKILDGELYNHELRDDFEKIISLVRKTKPTDQHRAEAKKLIQYHLYDVIPEQNILPSGYPTYKYRRGFLFWNVPKHPSLRVVDHVYVSTAENCSKIHKEYLKDGYEGSIYRSESGIYKHGRSYDLMKFKDFSDAEATIVNYEIGKGKREGTLGKFIMQDEDGNIFGCPPGKGYNYQDLTNILDNIHDYMGQVATFTYFERTKAGSYRHQQFKCFRNYE
jgi:DNA ligase-1